MINRKSLTTSLVLMCVIFAGAALAQVQIDTILTRLNYFEGQAFTTDIIASGGTTPYTWSSSGTMPPGLVFDQAGSTTGTVTIDGTVDPGTTASYTLTVTVTDDVGGTASKDFMFRTVIQWVEFAITPSTLPDGEVGTAYDEVLTANGDLNATYTWGTATGLPPGLTFNAAGSTTNTARLVGTPSSAGTYTFTVRASNDVPENGGALITLVVTSGSTGGNLTVSPGTLPAGTVGTAYNETLTVSGGTTADYTWAELTVPDGLPPGLTLTAGVPSTSAIISGNPTTAGTFGFSIRVQEVGGGGLVGSQAYSIVIDSGTIPTGPTITASTPADAVEGEVYGPETISASGGTAPYTWTISGGSLPTGLDIDTSLTGLTNNISGTPGSGTATGSPYTVTVQITDDAGLTDTQDFTVNVAAFGFLTDANLASATEGVAYSPVTIEVAGGTAPYVWQISTSSPAGLTGLTIDDTQTGTSTTFSGTPDAGTGGNSYALNIQVTDSSGGLPVTRTFFIAISPPSTSGLAFTTTTLADGTVGTAYSATVVTTGGTGPFTWALASGTLPTGVLLDTTATTNSTTLSGSPATAGDYSFVLRITDSSDSSFVDQSFQITVAGASLTDIFGGIGGGGGCSLSQKGSSLWILLLGGAAFACLLVRKPTRQKSVS